MLPQNVLGYHSISVAPSMSPSQRRLLRFFAVLLATCGAWYAVYVLWMVPDARLDAWLAYTVADQAGWLLETFGTAPQVEGRIVTGLGGAGVEVLDGCNGLATIGLFVGFVAAYPGRGWMRMVFIPAGILLIHAANVARVALLPVLQVQAPAQFELLHGLGTYFFYGVIFVLWVAWTHAGQARWPRPLLQRASPSPA